MARHSVAVDQKASTGSKHEVAPTIVLSPSGQVVLTSKAYETRLRRGQVSFDSFALFRSESTELLHHWHQSVQLTVERQGGVTYTIPAKVDKVDGQSATITPSRSLSENERVINVVATDRDGSSRADARNASVLLSTLQGSGKAFKANPWVQAIWQPGDSGSPQWPKVWTRANCAPLSATNIGIGSNLNTSQQEAVSRMLSQSDEHRITIVQGPPGTGKTSVIARFVQLAVESGRDGIWLVAHSNVAVKNIAEKLTSVGFLKYRLLVSKDYHHGW